MSKVKSVSKVAHRLYQQGGDIVITSDIWERDEEYVREYPQNIPHVGYDYRARTKLALITPFDAVVVAVRTSLGSTYGRQVFAYNEALNVTAHYAHLSSVNVKVGQPISKGTVIGVSGRSGVSENSYAAHLHFGLAKGKITNAGNKGDFLGDIWLDVELFDFDTVVEKGIKWHSENGVYTLDVNVNERKEPSVKSKKVKTHNKGKKLNYYAWANNEGYTWFKLDNGNFIAYGEIGIEIYGYDSNSNKQPGLVSKPTPPKKTRVGQILTVRPNYSKALFTAYDDLACTKPLSPWTLSRYKFDLQFKIIEDHDPVFRCTQYGKTPMSGTDSVYIKWEPGIGFD